jgi:endonuclease III
MNDIRTLLKVAARRLELSRFLACLHTVAIVAAAVALALMIADRLGARAFVPWVWVGPVLAAVALIAAGGFWARRRRSELQVALAVDERLDLREKLSTALHCEGRQDPFAQAAVEDAVIVARDRRTQEATRRRFRITPPGGWWISPLLVLLALVTSLVGPLDLFAEDEEEEAATVLQARQQAEETVEAVVRQIKESPELSKDMKDLLGELSKEGLDTESLQNPEQVKREAIKKVSEINKRLEEILGGQQGKTAEALRRNLSDLDSPQEGPASELAEAMAQGDFSSAKKALEEMMEKMQAGQMTEEQMQKAAEQLQALAEQLEKLAQQQQQLEKALEQAGLDPNLAKNAEALQQALQNNPNLNQQQIQQIQQMAQAQQAAAQMCQGLGQACAKMAQGMMQGQMGQAAQGAGQLGDQLNQMEQMAMLLQQAQAAANACQGQCQGLGQGLAMQKWGQGAGMGGWGQGSGGKAPIAPTPWKSKLEKADVNTDEQGDVIARMLFDGPEIVGESNIKARQIAVELLEAYDEAVDEEALPRKYHDPHKHYFGELQKRTEARSAGGDETAAPAAPAGSGGEGNSGAPAAPGGDDGAAAAPSGPEGS